jgi:hypothetical protein
MGNSLPLLTTYDIALSTQWQTLTTVATTVMDGPKLVDPPLSTGGIVLRSTKHLSTLMFGFLEAVGGHVVLVPGGMLDVAVMVIFMEGVSMEGILPSSGGGAHDSGRAQDDLCNLDLNTTSHQQPVIPFLYFDNQYLAMLFWVPKPVVFTTSVGF